MGLIWFMDTLCDNRGRAFTFRDSRPFAKGLNSPDGALPEICRPAFMPE